MFCPLFDFTLGKYRSALLIAKSHCNIAGTLLHNSVHSCSIGPIIVCSKYRGGEGIGNYDWAMFHQVFGPLIKANSVGSAFHTVHA